MSKLIGKFVKAELKKFDKDGKTIEWFDCLFLTKTGQLLKVSPVKEIRDEVVSKAGVDVEVNYELGSDEKFYPKILITSLE